MLVVALGQNPSEHLRMEGLHPAAEDFREARDRRHRGDGNAGFGEGNRGASGGEDLVAQGREAPAKIHHTVLVKDGDQSALLRFGHGVTFLGLGSEGRGLMIRGGFCLVMSPPALRQMAIHVAATALTDRE